MLIEKHFTISVGQNKHGSGGCGDHTCVATAPNLTILISWKINVFFATKINLNTTKTYPMILGNSIILEDTAIEPLTDL